MNIYQLFEDTSKENDQLIEENHHLTRQNIELTDKVIDLSISLEFLIQTICKQIIDNHQDKFHSIKAKTKIFSQRYEDQLDLLTAYFSLQEQRESIIMTQLTGVVIGKPVEQIEYNKSRQMVEMNPPTKEALLEISKILNDIGAYNKAILDDTNKIMSSMDEQVKQIFGNLIKSEYLPQNFTSILSMINHNKEKIKKQSDN